MEKKRYSKPSVKVVQWDFNEAVCNSVVANSFNVVNCFHIYKETAVNAMENRLDFTGDWEWTRTGSR
ncbi:MAG: hypothetical protein IIW35_04240 [Bacteroidaceae bacterium]|nr:hypothetical protein [Bacteroidaceae bacterium]MBQ5817545.1 hypothetical protein [Bacteroidaceae bacterium]